MESPQFLYNAAQRTDIPKRKKRKPRLCRGFLFFRLGMSVRCAAFYKNWGLSIAAKL
jgi:hypothetical protein